MSLEAQFKLMFNMKNYIICTSCEQHHYTNDVDCIKVQEDYFGIELITYKCPVTNRISKAYIMDTYSPDSIDSTHHGVAW